MIKLWRKKSIKRERERDTHRLFMYSNQISIGARSERQQREADLKIFSFCHFSSCCMSRETPFISADKSSSFSQEHFHNKSLTMKAPLHI